jgi:hypothetical protein
MKATWKETAVLLRAAALGSLLAVLLSPGAEPAEAAQHSKRVLIGAGLSGFYDDNVLQYSGDQITLFESGLNPERFSIESVHDMVWRPSLTLGLESRTGDGRGFDVSLRGRGEFHGKDKTADFRSISAEWRQYFSRKSSLALRAYYLPHFYLRQLFDDDVPAVPTHYRRAEFALSLGSLTWRQRVARGTWAGLSYQYEHRGYNAEFVERNSNTQEGVAEVTWTRLPRRGSFGLHGGYRRADAKGTDGDEAPGVPADDPDIGYHGVLAGVDGRMDLARWGRSRMGASLGYEYGTRDFTSDVPTDRYHFGRNDRDHLVQAGLRWSRPRWSLQSFYSYERNIAHLGAAAPPTTDVGTYSQSRVGLSLDWSGVLWRERGSRGSEAGEGADSP